MFLDRTLPPPALSLSRREIIPPYKISLTPEVPCYILQHTPTKLVNLSLVFKSGNYYAPKIWIPFLLAKMMLKGTVKKDASLLAQTIAHYGADISIYAGNDFFEITLTTLSYHLDSLLDLLLEVMQKSTFPEKEFQKLQAIELQHLKILQEKNSYLARQAFYQQVFGETHPYGKILTEKALKSTTRDDLVTYYKEHLFAEGKAFLSGATDEKTVQTLQDKLKNLPSHPLRKAGPFSIIPLPHRQKIQRPEQTQGCVMLGKEIPHRTHSDYMPCYFTLQLLGGYFGSRLMQNIREKKGYTYDIRATINHALHASWVLISSEVKQFCTEPTLKEVFYEIRVMQEKDPPEEEMIMLKNYLLGRFLSQCDHPFSAMRFLKPFYLHNLSPSYYKNYLQNIEKVTAAEVRAMSVKYFQGKNIYATVLDS